MEIVVIAHNIRSILNVGSILRSAESFGVKVVYLGGYTPNPQAGLPHVRQKLAAQLHKTALGTEKMLDLRYEADVVKITTSLKNQGFKIAGLEQDPRAVKLPNYRPDSDKIALLLGEEVAGIAPELRDLCDELVEIPQFGRKESLNVAVATGIALYALSQRKTASR
jgi:tRNA G18 (ribose-2'-O)-methylase SpoU